MIEPETDDQPSLPAGPLRQARLARQRPADIRLGLAAITAVLHALGNPQRRLPPVVHIAGTNGKGSVCAFLRAMAEAGGYRVHAFTSPALKSAAEQIRCAGKTLTAGALDELIDAVLAAAPHPPTPFEALTASAFLAFSKVGADLALIETGLGGREDATNVLDRPALTVLTTIAEDHKALIGPEIGNIALAKCGIIKPHVPVVVAPQTDEVADIIAAEAARLDAPLYRHGIEWVAFAERGRLVFQDDFGLLDLPLPALAGRHQIDNAGTAIAAIHALAGLGLDERAIELGLRNVHWPARLECLRNHAMLDRLAPGSEVWLDVGHNPHAAAALAEFAADLGDREPKRLVIVVALGQDKDAHGFFRPFAGLASQAITVTIEQDDAMASASALAAAAEEAGLVAMPTASLDAALSWLADKREALRVFICGSHTLARLLHAS